MSTHVEQVKQLNNGGRVTTRAMRVEDDAHMSQSDARAVTIMARVVWYIAGVLLVLLAFRFVLALLGANPTNQFANFIYSVSHLFVSPFFSLFGYNLRYGVSRFETYTLIAMLVYLVVAWGIAKLVTLKRDAEIDTQPSE
jgi:hypothetical protein